MIEAKHTPAGMLLADFLSGYALGRAFRAVRLRGEAAPERGPLLMVANHFSWWDGFIQYRLCRRLLGRKLYVMMLEEQLRRHPVLVRCGCFSVRRQSREAVESLDYALRILGDRGNAVLLFPQGRIESLHVGHIRFQSGVGYLLRRAPEGLRIGFNVNLPDYFAHRRPALNVYFESRAAGEFSSTADLEEAYNDFYQRCIRRQHEER